MSPRSRHGLSLLEVAAVLFCLAILAVLFFPAICSSRGAARRTQCLNNLRNIGLAVQNYASQNDGHFPSLHRDDGDPATTSDRFESWSRQLFRVLDVPAPNGPDVQISAAAKNDPSSQEGQYQPPILPVFTCPADDDSFQQPGGLSYVVNAGYGFFPVDRETGAVTETGRHSVNQDWDGDGDVGEQDRLITRATGVFWCLDEAVEPLTLDDVASGDGLGSTLLLTENLHAGPWTSRETRALAFVIGRERLTFDETAGPLAVKQADLGPFGVNGAKNANGLAPGPSSNHNGSVNVIWADGRGTSLAETIDPLIYVRLLTSQGNLYGQQPVEEDQF